MSTAADIDIHSYLPLFGLSAFRRGQSDVISAVLGGHDCLCIMPTGGGKSLCYQLPSVARDGLTLVVSPLIALMKDQVDGLQRLGLRATFINSTLPPVEQNNRLEAMARGEYDLVYVVPERFRNPRFRDAVRASKLQLLAIDEAHCVSEWGHDFRPDYARLGQYRKQLGNPTTIALTATATQAVRQDIMQLLDLREPKVFVTGFARPNLRYEILAASTQREKDDALVALLRDVNGSGIVYASTRKRCEEVVETIATRTRRRALVYHAGLPPDVRRETQDAFMAGEAEVIVATNAFGMGIDKPDVRFVVHYNMPGTIEAYYQEAGRAGRDGLPSRCLLLYSATDRYVQEFFIENANPSISTLGRVYDYLRGLDDDPIELTQEEIKDKLNLDIGADGVGRCEQLLEKAGALERLEPCQNMAVVSLKSDLPTLVDLLPPQAKTRRKVLRAIEKLVGAQRFEPVYFNRRDLMKLAEVDSDTLARTLVRLRALEAFDYVPPFRGRAVRMLRRDVPLEKLEIDFESLARRKAAEYEKLQAVCRFAESKACRQQELLHYFGEATSQTCGNCDNCLLPTGPLAQVQQITSTADPVHEAVRKVLSGVARTHGRFGRVLVAQMLCGSKAENVTRFRLDRLSTYGLLRQFTQSEVVAVIDALISIGCIEMVTLEPGRPTIQLSEQGEQVMRAQAPLASGLMLPGYLFDKLRGDAGTKSARPSELLADRTGGADAQLLATLKAWRNGLASQNNAPAYTVLGNAVLEELARAAPQSPEELLSIRGIGPAKLDRYGDELLALLRPHKQAAQPTDVLRETAPSSPASGEDNPKNRPAPESQRLDTEHDAPAAHAPVRQSAYRGKYEDLDEADAEPFDLELPAAPRALVPRPSYYWTWVLLHKGFTLAECVEIRGLNEDEILAHLQRAADDGRDIRMTWLLTPQQIARLELLVGDAPKVQIRPLLDKLPPGTRYEHVELFLKCRSCS